MGERLPFVVGRASGDQQIAIDRGLERRSVPLLQRIGRLHIVVSVEKDRRSVFASSVPLAIDEGVAFGVDLLGGQTGRTHLLDDKLRTPQHVFLVRRIGRY